MTQLYYRDLRRRIEALEAQCFPEPEPIVTVYALDPDDGLPTWVTTLGRSYWRREAGQPIPPEILHYAKPEARAAYEAKAREEAEGRPPPGD